MELWIRSQDREMLIKVFEVRLNWQNDNEIICNSYTSDCCDYDYRGLGTYASKERALEVLDEIQPLLKSKVLLNSGKILGSFEDTIYREPDKVEIQELNTIVYEMPKE